MEEVPQAPEIQHGEHLQAMADAGGEHESDAAVRARRVEMPGLPG